MISDVHQFIEILASDDSNVRDDCMHVEATESVWLELIRGYPNVRRTVASNKTISDTIIRELHKYGDAETRCELARKRRTPADLLIVMSNDPSDLVRHALVFHPHLPEEALRNLANDKSARIRETVVRHWADRPKIQ